jgi:hypothetical protein
MTNKIVEQDERTTSVLNVSYKFGFYFIYCLLGIDIVYRGLRFDEGSFDLVFIMLVSLLPTIAYQYKKKIYPKNMIRKVALVSVIIGILAFLSAVVIKKFLN